MNDKNLENNKNVEAVFKAIQDEVIKLGLDIKITSKDKWNKELRDGNRIVITNPEYSDFRVDIIGREWNSPGKCSTWFNTRRQRSIPAGKYRHDNTTRYESESFDFESFIPNDKLEELGITYQNYSRHIHTSLSKEFKATKNPKLVIKDVIPALKTYLELVKIAQPAINKHIEKREKTLKLQQRLEKLTYNPQPLYTLSRRSFRIKGIGELTVSDYGNIELKKDLSLDELEDILSNYNPEEYKDNE